MVIDNPANLSIATIEKMQTLLGERPKAASSAALRIKDELRIMNNVAALVQSQTPGTGALQLFAGSLADGWIPADGSAVSRTAYVVLFRQIGTTYGAGNGSTTFNVPNETHATLTWAIRI